MFKMPNLKVISLFLFFAFGINSIFARQCYQCSGTESCKSPNKTTCPDDTYGCGSITLQQTPNQVKDCMSIDTDTGLPMYLQGCLRTNLRELGLTNATICGCMGKDLCNSASTFNQSTLIAFISILLIGQKFL